MPGNGSESGFADELCSGAGQCALVRVRPVFVQRFGDEEIDQGIAEKLEALVVGSACAAVGQCLGEKLGG